ncbi:MAG: hypothetical protein IJ743_04345 [Bacilli bacterium]|nr:hypothetical protein [Bacilli bacterium]
MYWEIFILALLLLFMLNYTGRISATKFVSDNEVLFRRFKESDWDFYVKAKYGDGANPDFLFNKRVKNGLLTVVILLAFFVSNLSYISFLASLIVGFLVFKMDYSNIKKYYKAHLTEIDSMLPHYLKSLEILIQHYTVPVALGRSINDAPPIFREGLQEMINQINDGDDTITPYMNFAKMYPVRDSMRMMRLLYRLSLGSQEHKQEQLLAFSRTISNLTQKAREIKYKHRLEKMEGKTTQMLITTGLGVMVLLVLSVLMLMGM